MKLNEVHFLFKFGIILSNTKFQGDIISPQPYLLRDNSNDTRDFSLMDSKNEENYIPRDTLE